MDNDYIHCINELYRNDEIKSKYSLIEIRTHNISGDWH